MMDTKNLDHVFAALDAVLADKDTTIMLNKMVMEDQQKDIERLQAENADLRLKLGELTAVKSGNRELQTVIDKTLSYMFEDNRTDNTAQVSDEVR